MAKEDKELLLKDLCGRLPYGVICNTPKGNGHLCSINQTMFGNEYGINIKATKRDYFDDTKCDIKPYLRPMSSMTDEERTELSCLSNDKFKFYLYTRDNIIVCDGNHNHLLDSIHIIDWLNAHHFDYRRLIEKGLAIEVTKDNNPYKE